MEYKTIEQMPISTNDTPVCHATLVLFQSIDKQHKTVYAKEILKKSFMAGAKSIFASNTNDSNKAFEDWIKTFRL